MNEADRWTRGRAIFLILLLCGGAAWPACDSDDPIPVAPPPAPEPALPPPPEPLAPDDVELERTTEVLERWSTPERLEAFRADPNALLDLMRTMIADPEAVGVDEDALRRAGGQQIRFGGPCSNRCQERAHPEAMYEYFAVLASCLRAMPEADEVEAAACRDITAALTYEVAFGTAHTSRHGLWCLP